jgi:xanthine dehydrogenase accessory factor
MDEKIPILEKWINKKEKVAIATVINTWGSSPRKVGAKMLIDADGASSGSVSGGCVEGAVIAAGIEVIKNGIPRLLHYGVSDEDAWEVGLACGGEIEVFIRLLDWSIYENLTNQRNIRKQSINIILIDGQEDIMGQEILLIEKGDGGFLYVGKKDDSNLLAISEEIIQMQAFPYHSFCLERSNNIRAFVDIINPRPSLIIIGGVHITFSLLSFASELGFHTTIIDPRQKFSSRERFPTADKIYQVWPRKAFQEIELTKDTAVVLLTHDPKIDDQALEVLLRSPVFYIGALGNKETHQKRIERLLKLGIPKVLTDKIRGPIGLDIGAISPEEIALSIMAEIIQTWNEILRENGKIK